MADSSADNNPNPPPTYYKFIGMALAVSSGIFIGSSFVLKKKGLLRSSAVAGEGHAYLRSILWWTGMVMMIVGEICNFIAYSFAPALIVTPLGALSVVVCAVLSSMVLKEKLSLTGKIGCALCIVGAVVIVLHAPAQAAVTDIDQFKRFVIQPGFLVYMCLVIIGSLAILWRLAPKYGKKHLLVYVSVCSLIGSLSVVATQGLGAAIVLNITTGTPQFNHWFIYVTIIFVACTLITEINYLNKALNLFNTAIVTPVYYVFFTGATLVASVILFQGFSASAISIMTVVMGFIVICAGVVLLQTSKSAALSEAIIKPGSSLDMHAEEDIASTNTDSEKDDLELEPGPIGVRAVPFVAIREMVRASTMPSTSTTSVTGHGQNCDGEGAHSIHDDHYTNAKFFNRLRRRSEYSLASSSTHGQNLHFPQHGNAAVPQDESSGQVSSSSPPRPAALAPISEKAEYNEKDDPISETIPSYEPPK
ncbi:hypothetical protein BX616_010448 [Lobosporangium transversale]|uniref:Magnesium transporter NIPA-domain-containing protein n=1 Tax=Lobosporangium transversale TaxID=64571 RepID=A0A1Y2GCA9_9FUNG|nr:magnesium transporter NIPA-domain-containing protein [Lobosporangium transversale]KAF9918047.1 hypothetical protein BX616_010448 [Lobosporangium transversale]ORZ05882.1 magnesium transporter NIPA-domain-containing protein [Lobosporangium transversale]|eukprot:XP_021877263.1 magnesium transporter NIPA-domain-containing protein [Lobosporangium transversale]